MTPYLTALRCLFLVGLHHRVQLELGPLLGTEEGDAVGAMTRLMRESSLKGKILKNRTRAQLSRLGSALPAMVRMKSGHWGVIVNVVAEPEAVVLLDPREEQSGVCLVEAGQFSEDWDGTIMLVKRQYALSDTAQPFGWSWFLPEIIENGRYFRDVAIATIMSTLIAFATPMFFNIMIDKVIPHHSYQTLMAVVLAFVVATVFDGLFNYIRQYLMVFATNKIDARLASRTFEHLLRLPMQFFESVPSGVLMRNIQQTEAVRGFLTGQLFFTLLDTLTLPILLVGLSLYSIKLTLVVLLFSAAIAAVIGFMVPTFRRYLESLYEAEGSRQADLVETIHGMRAVKSLALETQRRHSWDQKVAIAVRRRGAVGRLGALGSVLTNGMQHLMQIIVLAIGAADVFDGTLSMGALIAFNMLSGRVTGPLIQLVGLINQYEQTAMAIKMLATIMNHRPERDINQRGIRPVITGQMDFDDVIFSYEGSSRPALNRISFKVEEGQVIGIVGRSGSGKTTITRMVQGIHTAQQGLIRLNGNDIRHMDLAHLRRSIGVVLQENILFRGTIRDNIAASKPSATLPEVMEAARLAGADEFIDRLPLSYETVVGEGASNFSGGQRQRIAIARALLSQPRLLIFDEATSALDPESEAIVQENLDKIAAGRTMIIVSHRLSSLVKADAILVLEQGEVADFAPHADLLERCEIYRHLWQQQTRHLS